MKYFSFLVFSVALIGCSIKGNNMIPLENQTILKEVPLSLIPEGSQRIDLTLKDISNLPVLAFNHINSRTYRSANLQPMDKINQVLSNYSKYNIQYYGYIKDKKRFIFLNYFINSNNNYNDWRSIIVLVKDGGASFWRIVYCIDNRSFYNLEINGDA